MTIALTVGLLAGCAAETRQRVLAFFFDGVETERREPPPPTRRVRQDLLREIEDLRRELALARAADAARDTATRPAGTERPIERARTWDEASRLLPKDPAGRVDWAAAMRAGVVAPRPGPDPGTPGPAVFDLDTDLARAPSRLFAVRFSHTAHTPWLACGSCHPTLFPLGRSATPARVTMAAIRAGQACGACHGRVAFGVEGACARCHAAPVPTSAAPPVPAPRPAIERARTWEEAAGLLPRRNGTTDWARALADGAIAPRSGPGPGPREIAPDVLDLDVRRTSPAGEEYETLFRHATHTAWLGCESCHPSPYQQQGGATPMSMEQVNAGQLCGSCHGPVAFPVSECERCHPRLGGDG